MDGTVHRSEKTVLKIKKNNIIVKPRALTKQMVTTLTKKMMKPGNKSERTKDKDSKSKCNKSSFKTMTMYMSKKLEM